MESVRLLKHIAGFHHSNYCSLFETNVAKGFPGKIYFKHLATEAWWSQ